jgi:para-nitrobenzyl esterase
VQVLYFAQRMIFNLLFVVALCFLASATPVVQTTQGAVRGWTDGDGINWFLGIPYGVVDERFGASSVAPSWNGTRDATNYGPICWQPPPIGYDMAKNVTMSEDCLSLNIWTPNNTTNSTQPLAVLFWIYGGGLQQVSHCIV